MHRSADHHEDSDVSASFRDWIVDMADQHPDVVWRQPGKQTKARPGPNLRSQQ